MQLDVLTLVAMGSFVAACAGAALLVAWWQNRRTSALLLWGVANSAAALGILCLVLRSALQQPVWAAAGGSLLTLAASLMWKGARAFDAKPAPLGLVLLGPLSVAIVSFIPGLHAIAGTIARGTALAYFAAVAVSFWLSRNDRLSARWPIIVLTGVHAAVLALGAYSYFSGSLSQDQLPPILSLFGLIHFESIIFTLGTAVFLFALVKERNEAASRMAARIDPLTGIANRTAFLENAERVIERCRRDGAPVSVIMFDLDRFKAINDSYGHATGDAVIQKFCEVVGAALRSGDPIGRIGGEEFAAVLPCSSIEATCARADRIRIAFADGCRLIGNHRVDATVSCGVSASAGAEQALSLLLEAADAALYFAKAEGRNRVKRADQPAPERSGASVIRVA